MQKLYKEEIFSDAQNIIKQELSTHCKEYKINFEKCYDEVNSIIRPLTEKVPIVEDPAPKTNHNLYENCESD